MRRILNEGSASLRALSQISCGGEVTDSYWPPDEKLPTLQAAKRIFQRFYLTENTILMTQS